MLIQYLVYQNLNDYHDNIEIGSIDIYVHYKQNNYILNIMICNLEGWWSYVISNIIIDINSDIGNTCDMIFENIRKIECPSFTLYKRLQNGTMTMLLREKSPKRRSRRYANSTQNGS